MKYLLFFLLLFSAWVTVGQFKKLGTTPSKRLKSPPATMAFQEYPCRLTYFKNTRQISTSYCQVAEHPLRGAATAYDRRGNIIYQRETRRYAGHASVDFTYHPNGAVYTANYSSAPDAGIQWYESTHYFDPAGNLVDVKSRSHEDLLSIQLDTNKTLSNPAVYPSYEVMKCAEIWVTSLWILNTTSDTLKAEHHFTGMREPALVTFIAPRTPTKITDLLEAERFANLQERLQLVVFNLKTGKRISFSFNKTKEERLSRTEKRITLAF